VVDEDAAGQDRVRQVVEHRRERVRDRLGLEVRVEAGQVGPARVAADLDEARAEHDPEREPPHQHDRRHGRRARGERARIPRVRERGGEQRGLEDLDLPAEAEPELAEPDVRAVDRPQREERWQVRVAEREREREREPGVRPPGERAVGGIEPEQARHVPERAIGRAEALEVRADRGQPVLAEERRPLAHEAEERKDVDHAEQAEDQRAGQPVVARRAEPRRQPIGQPIEQRIEQRRRAQIRVGEGRLGGSGNRLGPGRADGDVAAASRLRFGVGRAGIVGHASI
jgi:hypothetical protein